MRNCCAQAGTSSSYPMDDEHSTEQHTFNLESKLSFGRNSEIIQGTVAELSTTSALQQPANSKCQSLADTGVTVNNTNGARWYNSIMLRRGASRVKSSTAVNSSKAQDPMGSSSNKGMGPGHSHEITEQPSCMDFLRKSRCRSRSANADGRPNVANSSRGCTPKAASALRNRLLSLQSSGSWIPAVLGPSTPPGEDSNHGPSTNTAADSAAASVVGSDSSSSLQGCQKTSKQGHQNCSHQGLDGNGLMLVVSSHSNSSHHGSPRVCEGISSSRCSSDSGHTAFASIATTPAGSGSLTPDSMLSALSNTSSCLSIGSSSYTSGRTPWPATATASSASSSPRLLAKSLDFATEDPAPKTALSQQQVQVPSAARSLTAVSLASAAPAPSQVDYSPAAQQQEQHVTAPAPAAGTVPAVAAAAAVSVGAATGVRSGVAMPVAAEQGSQQVPASFWQCSGWSFGSHSEQNLRAYMEDRSVAVDFTGHAGFPAVNRAGLFSVYDGHGGHQVAEFLAENVQSALLAAGPGAIAAEPLRVLGNAVHGAEMQLLLSYAEGDLTAAAGSTLCAVLLIDDKLHVAHVGDSRAVLARGPTAKQLTRDHKPECEVEALRIRGDDPEAEISPDGYIYGELAVARAIGSAHLKRDPSKKALIATPEVVTVQLEKQDDFVIVATDGLWDTMSSSEAVSVARRVLSDTRDASATSRALVERAQRCGSSDNISVVTLLLHSRGIVVPRSNSRLFKRPVFPPAGSSESNAGNA